EDKYRTEQRAELVAGTQRSQERARSLMHTSCIRRYLQNLPLGHREGFFPGVIVRKDALECPHFFTRYVRARSHLINGCRHRRDALPPLLFPRKLSTGNIIRSSAWDRTRRAGRSPPDTCTATWCRSSVRG